MVTEELLRYISQERRRGVPDERIRATLESVGWKSDDLDEAFTKAPRPVTQKKARPIHAFTYLTPLTIRQYSVSPAVVQNGGTERGPLWYIVFYTLLVVLAGTIIMVGWLRRDALSYLIRSFIQ